MFVTASPHLLEGVVQSQPQTGWIKSAWIRLEHAVKDLFGNLTSDQVIANAFAAVLIAGIMGVILGGIFIVVGLYLTATLNNAMPSVNDTSYNASKTVVQGNINTAFQILGVALIFGSIGVIIASLMGWVGGGAPAR